MRFGFFLFDSSDFSGEDEKFLSRLISSLFSEGKQLQMGDPNLSDLDKFNKFFSSIGAKVSYGGPIHFGKPMVQPGAVTPHEPKEGHQVSKMNFGGMPFETTQTKPLNKTEEAIFNGVMCAYKAMEDSGTEVHINGAYPIVKTMVDSKEDIRDLFQISNSRGSAQVLFGKIPYVHPDKTDSDKAYLKAVARGTCLDFAKRYEGKWECRSEDFHIDTDKLQIYYSIEFYRIA